MAMMVVWRTAPPLLGVAATCVVGIANAQRDIISSASQFSASSGLRSQPSTGVADDFPLLEQQPPNSSDNNLELTLMLLFFVLLLALLFICALYSVCGQSAKCRVLRRVESQSFDAMVTRSRSYFREDLLDEDEILRLWICFYCDFANYEMKTHCALCGNEKHEKYLPSTTDRKTPKTRPASFFSTVATTISSVRSLSPSFLRLAASPSRSQRESSSVTWSTSDLTSIAVDIDTSPIAPASLSNLDQTTSPQFLPFPLEASSTVLSRRREWQAVIEPATGDVLWGHRCQNLSEGGDDIAASTSTIPDELVVRTAFVAHTVATKASPHGKLKFKKAQGTRVRMAYRLGHDDGVSSIANVDPLAVDALRKLSFPEKHRWFMQETTSILHVRWNNPTLELPSEDAGASTTLIIPRDDLFHGTMKALNDVPQTQLKRPLRIKFKNEPGVDAGGIVREWFSLAVAEFLDEKNGLFRPVHTNSSAGDGSGLAYTIHPSVSISVGDHLLYFRAFGRLLGKALLEGHLISVPLADFLIKHILSMPVSFADLHALDGGLARSLLLLWQTPLTEVGSGSEEDPYSLDFSVYDLTRGVVDLKKNGRNVVVTESNKHEYIALYTKWHLGRSVAEEVSAIVGGVYDVIPVHLLAPFDYEELRLMLCGSPTVDAADWEKKSVIVGKKTSKNAKVVAWFWKIVRGLPMDQRCRLLQFATGTARVPVQGFRALTSSDGRLCPFTIYCVPKDECAFIRAYTCFNRLDLPLYKTETELAAAIYLVLQLDITGFTIQ